MLVPWRRLRSRTQKPVVVAMVGVVVTQVAMVVKVVMAVAKAMVVMGVSVVKEGEVR